MTVLPGTEIEDLVQRLSMVAVRAAFEPAKIVTVVSLRPALDALDANSVPDLSNVDLHRVKAAAGYLVGVAAALPSDLPPAARGEALQEVDAARILFIGYVALVGARSSGEPVAPEVVARLPRVRCAALRGYRGCLA